MWGNTKGYVSGRFWIDFGQTHSAGVQEDAERWVNYMDEDEATSLSSLLQQRIHEVRIGPRGIYQFIGGNKEILFQVSHDHLFDGDGNRFHDDLQYKTLERFVENEDMLKAVQNMVLNRTVAFLAQGVSPDRILISTLKELGVLTHLIQSSFVSMDAEKNSISVKVFTPAHCYVFEDLIAFRNGVYAPVKIQVEPRK